MISLVVLFAGCSSQPRTVVFQDPDAAVWGSKPDGYPKTVLKALPDRPGFCVKVTEDWEPRELEGRDVWYRSRTVESLSCTKERWRGLTMGR